MSTLHDIATHQYTEHYARMNPSGLNPDHLPKRTYRNMELMYGSIVDQLTAGQAVLDVGCGTGFFLRWLAHRPALRLHGVDACDGQVELARAAVPTAEIALQDASCFLDGKDSQFGAIFCIDMLEHVETE